VGRRRLFTHVFYDAQKGNYADRKQSAAQQLLSALVFHSRYGSKIAHSEIAHSRGATRIRTVE
jgi:hypothetical protein